MLLRENFLILKSLHLSQAEFPWIRECFKVSERMAKSKTQYNFIRRCIEYEVYPKTIENLHLPQFYEHPNFSNKASFIKKSIMKHMKRYLQSRYYQESSTALRNEELILDTYQRIRAQEIIAACKESYKLTIKSQESHMKIKFNAILNNKQLETTRFGERNKDKAKTMDMVTDLTQTLEPEEISLLSKGPKFAVQERFSEKTKLDVRVQLCRMGYQLRWHQQRQNQEDTRTPLLPKYPESNFVKVPPQTDIDTEIRIHRCQTEITPGVVRV